VTNVYGNQHTYINKVMTLTPKEFGDKIDLFYDDIASDERILAVNISADQNLEMDVHVVVDVPEHTDPQEYFATTIDAILKAAISRSSLSVTPKVAARIEESVLA